MTSENRKLHISLAGAGTVGSAVIRLLRENADSIAANCGRRLEVCSIAVRDVARAKKRLPKECASLITDSWKNAAEHPQSEVVVELMGGDSAECGACIKTALAGGKSVVTANKALLAEFGDEIFPAARAAERPVAFEAAIAGCIPIVKTLRESLCGDKVEEVAGIINGTCNYIISAMSRDGTPFAEALSDAQKCGYAEADPTLDIDGIDAAHKIALIARLAFGANIKPKDFLVSGVRDFDPCALKYAAQFGFAIKLLAQAIRTKDGVAISVEPTLIPREHPLASIGGAMNAVSVLSHYAGETMYYGAGAGGDATAVAVVADLMDIARQTTSPEPNGGKDAPTAAPADDFCAPFFLRLRVLDKPGVLAEIAGTLAAENISIEAIHQNESAPGREVDIIMLLHENTRGRVRRAAASITKMDSVFGDILILPIRRFTK